MHPFQATGHLLYDPTAGKAKNDWWLILECPTNILDYYHAWIQKETGHKLNKPLFSAHVSVIRGETPPPDKQQLWKKHQALPVAFSYSNDIQTDGDFFWLPVTCDPLSAIREELGLSSTVPFGFHLTIGRLIRH